MSGPTSGEEPGSPPSNVRTVKDSTCPLTFALPWKVAHGQLIWELEMEIDLMSTPSAWSWYTRFPLVGQHCTVNPKVALPPTLALLEALSMTMTAHNPEVIEPSQHSCPPQLGGMLPPPVTLPGSSPALVTPEPINRQMPTTTVLRIMSLPSLLGLRSRDGSPAELG